MARRGSLCALIFGVFVGVGAQAQPAFVNWESPHVHPLDMTPDGTTLLAVNTADNRLELFDLTGNVPVHTGSIPVGLDPVSVRARSNTETWVVNHISDSVSVVSLDTMNVVDTIRTDDEPTDVVFAGTPERAFVSCAQANTVLVINPSNPHAPIFFVGQIPAPRQPQRRGPLSMKRSNDMADMVGVVGLDVTVRIPIQGEDPRAMAVSPDGNEVYVAVFESGNNTTILAGGSLGNPPSFGTDPVNDPLSPYFDPNAPFERGVNPPNPPPNDGDLFFPPINPDLPLPPLVGMIVRKNNAGQWMDDNAHDWTDLVSGPNADVSNRPVGWSLADHDVVVLNATDLSVQYATGLMNICMAIAVNPTTRQVTVVGTDATNEVRFEPVLNGRFLRVNIGLVDPATPGDLASHQVVDLNPHLVYTTVIPFEPIPQQERDLSIGDPRGIVWDSTGTRGWVSGMGSNNVVVIDERGNRTAARPIPVGEGPTGLVLDEARDRLYVLNKFDASLSVVDINADTELSPRVPLFDPTPAPIKTGRKHLYDTHRNSGLGHISCASCHVDSRLDLLAWDLGNPAGTVKTFNQNCNSTPGAGCDDWHPMKGPMTTQTLQDIIGNEPFHWRGDRDGLEAFAGAFNGLLGDDQPLPPADMQEFEDMLASIHFPPNPNREFDNSLPVDLPLPGHFASGRFANQGGLPAGTPLPNGNAQAGLDRYRTPIDGALKCVTCHTLPTGMGSDGVFIDLGNGPQFVPLPVGPNGEHHITVVSSDGSTNRTIKIPHLRNQYEKTGFDTTQLVNTSGFGFLHDGSVDSIARFISLPAFSVVDDQEVADLVAFMLAFGGSDLPEGDPNDISEPPGVASQDTHAAVGWQTTLADFANPLAGQLALIADMIALADSQAVGLVVKGVQNSEQRGYVYIGGSLFQSDRADEVLTSFELPALALPGSELTFTVVPFGTQTRIGIDRDLDGFFDRDEIDGCADPSDPNSVPPLCVECFPAEPVSPEPNGVDKNRYISVVPGTPGRLTAIRVRFTTTSDTGQTIEQIRWLGQPKVLPTTVGTTPITVAGLRCDPLCLDWSEIGLVHVFGPDVRPESEYAADVIDCGCDFSDSASFTTPLLVTTAQWGDIVEPFGISGQPNFSDISAVVDTFTGAAGAPIVVLSDLAPVIPDQGADFADISKDVDAFAGAAYPFGPGPGCP